MAWAKGNSKAIASNFIFKAGFADNKRTRAIIHHWGAGGGGSHYNMAGNRQCVAQRGSGPVRCRGCGVSPAAPGVLRCFAGQLFPLRMPV